MLKQILESMINANEKQATTLSRGLAVGFTPTSYEAGVDFRVVWSRRDVKPSEKEDSIMVGYLLSILKERGYDPQIVKKDTDVVVSDGWISTVLILRVSKVYQENLFE